MFGFGKYTYNREELGDVSLLLPLVLLAAILGVGGYMIYRKDAEEDDYYDDDEEVTSGKESIKAIDKIIRKYKANPELLD